MKNPEAASCSMLVHMTNTSDEVLHNNDQNKHSKPSAFHEMHCETAISQEDMTKITLKPNPSASTIYENIKQSQRGSFSEVQF